ncbi:hypothetical protein [Crenothrix polyspora]|uniref:Glycine zipper 2TM domain-containing protein n=1 Tax=Crenothrix polyspora TaxID=360316 RepID=A0A1R4H215_9GAMM|nr:hypothetical protein [Crenothrix polyspora]SJM90268.1 conserved exported hypothetical protein [Crenothrix polyspora]
MKKLLFLIQLTLAIALYSDLSFADHGHHRRHHGHHGHHGGYGGGGQNFDNGNRYPQQAYYQQPQYQPDPRSHQGLAGSVVGSVLGYEMGNGHPLGAGLGAAAGAFLGNGMAR